MRASPAVRCHRFLSAVRGCSYWPLREVINLSPVNALSSGEAKHLFCSPPRSNQQQPEGKSKEMGPWRTTHPLEGQRFLSRSVTGALQFGNLEVESPSAVHT